MRLLLKSQVVEVPDEYREAFTAGELPAHVGRHDLTRPLLGLAVEFEEIKPNPEPSVREALERAAMSLEEIALGTSFDGCKRVAERRAKDARAALASSPPEDCPTCGTQREIVVLNDGTTGDPVYSCGEFRCPDDPFHAGESRQEEPGRGKIVAVKDGLPGCPETQWDGPYSFRCSMGTVRCSKHGPFETRRGFLPSLRDEGE